MAALNLSVEDSSALIRYDPAGAWTNPSGDPLSQSYSGASFHTTSVKGATASITFNGTGINIFAGARPDYGSFQLLIDGNVVVQANASSSSSEFDKLIASSTGLTNGPHTAVLEHTDQSPIDIDRIELVTEMGLPGSILTIDEYDDSNSSFIYGPSDAAWNVNNADIFGNSSLHFSNNSQASASLTWDGGDGFSVWTTMAPDHGDFELILDGERIQTCSGGSQSVTALRTKILMYYTDSLGPGQHTLELKAMGQGGPFVDLDSVVVYSTSGGNAAEDQAFPPGVIAGIALGGLLFLILAVGLIVFALKKRRGGPNEPVQAGGIDIEVGMKQEHSMNRVPPSTTSSFFPSPKSRDDHSGPPKTPPSYPMPMNGFIQNRGAREHQSVQPEVVYPAAAV